MAKIALLVLSALYYPCISAQAQPFTLKYADANSSFSLTIYYGSKGKGAFVQYSGQKGIIPLQLKSYKRINTSGKPNQADDFVYVWNEIINGKTAGIYSLREGQNKVTAAWYLRGKDNKQFNFILQDKTFDDCKKLLLYGTLIEFNSSLNDTLIFRYPDKSKSVVILPEIVQPEGTRRSYIADYNFDGYDDLAFSVADAGMGVYQNFIISLYDPKFRKFHTLKEPDYNANARCSCLCDVIADESKKELRTSCRGGARWWRDVWRFKNNKLIWVRSETEPTAFR